VRVVRHGSNRGISPARATAVDHARGEWFVMLDSDWELLPYSLTRLHTLIDQLPPRWMRPARSPAGGHHWLPGSTAMDGSCDRARHELRRWPLHSCLGVRDD
jgi:GT2 family glycosyltransferase